MKRELDSRGEALPWRCRVRCTDCLPRAPSPSRGDRLLALVAEIERLDNGARYGPENFVVGKPTIASQPRSLARELDTTGGTP